MTDLSASVYKTWQLPFWKVDLLDYSANPYFFAVYHHALEFGILVFDTRTGSFSKEKIPVQFAPSAVWAIDNGPVMGVHGLFATNNEPWNGILLSVDNLLFSMNIQSRCWTIWYPEKHNEIAFPHECNPADDLQENQVPVFCDGLFTSKKLKNNSFIFIRDITPIHIESYEGDLDRYNLPGLYGISRYLAVRSAPFLNKIPEFLPFEFTKYNIVRMQNNGPVSIVKCTGKPFSGSLVALRGSL